MGRQSFGMILLYVAMASHSDNVSHAAELLNDHWLVTSDLHGTPIYGRLDIEQQGHTITGQFYGDKFDGSVDGNAIHFIAKSGSGVTEKVDGAR
jgi:amidase